MRLLGKALTIGWQRVQLEDAQLQDWMSQRSECQRSCMVKVIGFSLKTLWAVGEFSSASGQGAFAKALGDAVRACYPGFRALNIDHITQKVALYVGQELRKTHPQLASESGFATKPRALQQNDIEPCLSPGLDEEQRSSFIERMRAAVKEAISEARKRSWHILEHDARPCQHHCHEQVLKHTVETLWDSGILSLGNSDALALTALQGAVSSCLTNLPEQVAAELAGEALVRFQHPRGTGAAQPAVSPAVSVAPVPPVPVPPVPPAVEETPGLYGDCTRQRRCSGKDVRCYAQNQFFAQCLRHCPEHWDCSDAAPIHS